jgi:hypothetical protein
MGRGVGGDQATAGELLYGQRARGQRPPTLAKRPALANKAWQVGDDAWWKPEWADGAAFPVVIYSLDQANSAMVTISDPRLDDYNEQTLVPLRELRRKQ